MNLIFIPKKYKNLKLYMLKLSKLFINCPEIFINCIKNEILSM